MLRLALAAARRLARIWEASREEQSASRQLLKLQAQLRESEARTAGLMHGALDAIVVADERGCITAFNPAAERLFGHVSAKVIGKQVADLVVPEGSRDAHRAGMRRLQATGEGPILNRRIETDALRADGTTFPVELTIVPTKRGESRVFTAYLRDITQLRVATEALRVSEARFRHLFTSGIIGIIITDTSGAIYEANDAFLRVIGYSREELNGGRISWAEITPQKWRSTDEAAIAELARTGAAGPWEKEYIRKDGSIASVIVGVALVEAGRSVAFVLDLSAQRQAESAKSHALAAAHEAERALRIAEEQLRQSQKMEAIGVFAGSIAHDFNNLLSVILSAAEMLRDDLEPEHRTHEELNDIERAGLRGAELTHQLLAFSRRQLLQTRAVDLRSIVAGTGKMLERVIGEDIELLLKIGNASATVLVDAGQIEQVLMNLVVNARDAMPRGGVLTIETSTLELDLYEASQRFGGTAGRYVALSVRDTGTGIDRETQARVFEPFFTTKERGKGTGLGLSTVYGIVKQSGGHISVESEPGSGAVFTVFLPWIDAEPEPNSANHRVPSDTIGSESLLVVEDDAEVRRLAATVLRRQGYSVVEAGSAEQALELCQDRSFTIDLLLTDIVLPRMNGPELWKQLSGLRPELRVLFMSGYADDAIVRHGALASTNPIVKKPLTPSALLRAVRSVLDNAAELSRGVLGANWGAGRLPTGN